MEMKNDKDQENDLIKFVEFVSSKKHRWGIEQDKGRELRAV